MSKTLHEQIAGEILIELCGWNTQHYLEEALKVKEGDSIMSMMNILRNASAINFLLAKMDETSVLTVGHHLFQMVQRIKRTKTAQTGTTGSQSDLTPTHAFTRPTAPPRANPVHKPTPSATELSHAFEQYVLTARDWVRLLVDDAERGVSHKQMTWQAKAWLSLPIPVPPAIKETPTERRLSDLLDEAIRECERDTNDQYSQGYHDAWCSIRSRLIAAPRPEESPAPSDTLPQYVDALLRQTHALYFWLHKITGEGCEGITVKDREEIAKLLSEWLELGSQPIPEE